MLINYLDNLVDYKAGILLIKKYISLFHFSQAYINKSGDTQTGVAEVLSTLLWYLLEIKTIQQPKNQWDNNKII